MIIRKLRLQRAWSQEQLAEMVGVSVRTIQRLERGRQPSLETIKALAAVFEVDVETFNVETLNNEAFAMESSMPVENRTANPDTNPTHPLQDDERKALNYVKGLKEFYTHLIIYGIFVVCFLIFTDITRPYSYWSVIGWGIGVLFHGLAAFEIIGFGSARWERRLVEKRLGRKL